MPSNPAYLQNLPPRRAHLAEREAFPAPPLDAHDDFDAPHGLADLSDEAGRHPASGCRAVIVAAALCAVGWALAACAILAVLS